MEQETVVLSDRARELEKHLAACVTSVEIVAAIKHISEQVAEAFTLIEALNARLDGLGLVVQRMLEAAAPAPEAPPTPPAAVN